MRGHAAPARYNRFTELADPHSVTLYAYGRRTAEYAVGYNFNLAGHYEHTTEQSYSNRAAAGRAGIVGGNPAGRLRCRDAATTGLRAAAACLRGAPAPGL